MSKRKNAGRGKPPAQLSTPAAPPGTVAQWPGLPQNRAARRAKPLKPRVRRPLTQLENGEIGYGCDPVRRDDCFRAAVATVTQVPVEQVPDLRLADRLRRGEDPDTVSLESWERIIRWAERRGLRLTLHKTVPADRARWIGVYVVPLRTRIQDPYPFVDHCLVLSYGDIIFDPGESVIAPRGMRVAAFRATDVTYGLSFDPIDPQERE